MVAINNDCQGTWVFIRQGITRYVEQTCHPGLNVNESPLSSGVDPTKIVSFFLWKCKNFPFFAVKLFVTHEKMFLL